MPGVLLLSIGMGPQQFVAELVAEDQPHTTSPDQRENTAPNRDDRGTVTIGRVVVYHHRLPPRPNHQPVARRHHC
jgi:hypothetical protein